VVLANPNLGPELVYRTPWSVVAAPYHRNTAGNLDTHRFFTSEDEAVSRRILQDRRVELVVLCPEEDEPFFGGSAPGRPSLFSRMLDGDAPPWLRAVTWPGVETSGYLVFEAVHD
jgi:hypothetical protein